MAEEPRQIPGTLTLVATPIGNLGDMTHRAVEVLRSAHTILAEDTRHSRRLLDHYGISARPVAYHDHNKERVTPGIIEDLLAGKSVAVITDAGTPGISDPGFYVVRAAIEAGVPVTAAPGASAATTALVLSGFPTDRFVFEGFTPKKKGELARTMESLGEEPRTVIFYVAPHQLIKVLETIAEVLPERRVAVARELTKIHEEIIRGTAAELLERYRNRRVRGEIVLLVSGAPKKRAHRGDSGPS
jgi:16S rRNA (cytidine1402-2'-O)-methyltransferase